jgi:hypothetical protein
VITRFSDTVFQPGQGDFTDTAIAIFAFQYQYNPVYKSYVDGLGVCPGNVKRATEIPFLPISFFKTQQVQTTSFEPELIFESSGTSQFQKSKHRIKSLSIYQQSFTKGFERFYGPVSDWCILGLLPSYFENAHSSLICMVSDLIKASGQPESGFYLYDHQKLYEILSQLEEHGRKTLLIGVTHALMDFAEHFRIQLNHTVLMETGGMKGRRKELTRQETHHFLKERMGLEAIHSEYGMTELLSQAYSAGQGLFQPVPWMKCMVRAEDDPLEVKEEGPGILNVIDLANIYSCSFIATDDVGSVSSNGNFEVWGRMDYSDVRGCNLLVGGDSDEIMQVYV